MRNTRSVFPIRLSDRERAQIAGAAKRRELTVSGFVRQAALAASALVQGKATVKAQAPQVAESQPRVLFLDDEPDAHWVDGERVGW